VRAVARCAVGLAALLFVGTASSGAETETYFVDPAQSRVRVHLGRAGLLGFLGHDHTIEAPISQGRVEVHPDRPQESLVDLRWKAAALAVVPGTEPAKDVPEVEARMRGPEVLAVEEYPEIRLWSFEIDVGQSDPGSGRWSLNVKAGLELKGARHTVELPLDVRREGDEIVVTGEVKLWLKRLGIEPPVVAGVVKVANDFRVTFEVHARWKSAPGETDEATREGSTAGANAR
jgi:polyisoprenoid-binding protein YceI